MSLSLPSSRVFECANCSKQIRICTLCDSGQSDCSDVCNIIRLRKFWCKASAKYQDTHKGRKKHAARQARYHAGLKKKSKKMTHTICHKVDQILLPVEITAAGPITTSAERKETAGEKPEPEPKPEPPTLSHPQQHKPVVRCDFCGRPCSKLTRLVPLSRRKTHKQRRSPRQPVFGSRSAPPPARPRLRPDA